MNQQSRRKTPAAPTPEPDAPVVRITSPEDWKKSQRHERLFTLPSGMVFRVKNVDLGTLVSLGRVPLPLLKQVMSLRQKAQHSKAMQDPSKVLTEIDPAELEAIDRMAREVTLAAVVEPKLSREPEEGAIPVNELAFVDVLAIQQECTMEDPALYAAFFRGGK